MVSLYSALIPTGLLQFKDRSFVQVDNISLGLFPILQHFHVLHWITLKLLLKIILHLSFTLSRFLAVSDVERFNASFSESNLCSFRQLYITISNKSYLFSSRLATNQPMKQFFLFSGVFIG